VLHIIIYSTLGQLATGILLFIACVPPSKIGKGFGRFHAAFALALWLTACWGHFTPLFYALTVALVLTSTFSQFDSVYYPLLIVSQALSFLLLIQPELSMGVVPAVAVNLPAVLVLGGSAVSMLLGHWYLVAPGLPIRYLKIVTIALIAAIVLRSGLVLVETFRNQSALSSAHFYEIYGFFFIQRVVFGLLLTLVLSVMTYYCVKIRSTQSATGILYVVVVFSLVGELIGRYLFAKTGVLF
jgi:hypothetical protein